MSDDECKKCDERTCRIHVDCDRKCQALVDPETLEEWKAAAIHWEDHSYLSGCSHGC